VELTEDDTDSKYNYAEADCCPNHPRFSSTLSEILEESITCKCKYAIQVLLDSKDMCWTKGVLFAGDSRG